MRWRRWPSREWVGADRGRGYGTGECWDGRKEVAEWLSSSGQTAGGGPSVVELVRQRLVEREVGYGLGLGEIEGRGLIEE